MKKFYEKEIVCEMIGNEVPTVVYYKKTGFSHLQRLWRSKKMCKYCERQRDYGWGQPSIALFLEKMLYQ